MRIFLKVQPGGCETGRWGGRGGDGGKIKWKLSEVYTKTMSRGQNELVGNFKMAAGNVISIWGVDYEVHIHFNRN